MLHLIFTVVLVITGVYIAIILLPLIVPLALVAGVVLLLMFAFGGVTKSTVADGVRGMVASIPSTTAPVITPSSGGSGNPAYDAIPTIAQRDASNRTRY